jgi:predicted tellurium resistance membrane protein TerC
MKLKQPDQKELRKLKFIIIALFSFVTLSMTLNYIKHPSVLQLIYLALHIVTGLFILTIWILSKRWNKKNAQPEP